MTKKSIQTQACVNQHTESLYAPAVEQQYIAPDIEIIDMEICQNFLTGGGSVPTLPGQEG